MLCLKKQPMAVKEKVYTIKIICMVNLMRYLKNRKEEK
jgi:hypothetical protein